MIVAPHRVLSREVTDSDLERVVEEVSRMLRLIRSSKGCVALAHPQIEDKDPLRFYVLADGMVVINPVIERHSSYFADSVEGCMSFDGQAQVRKNRWRKVDISFCVLTKDMRLERTKASLKGLPSFVAQHEIDHLNAKYCYDKED